MQRGVFGTYRFRDARPRPRMRTVVRWRALPLIQLRLSSFRSLSLRNLLPQGEKEVLEVGEFYLSRNSQSFARRPGRKK
jgi:hypothetical protein